MTNRKPKGTRSAGKQHGSSDQVHNVEQEFPLLRTTLIALLNALTAYMTLVLVPRPESTDKDATFNSLPWTLATLYICQTLIGLAQFSLHESARRTRRNSSKEGSVSLLTVLASSTIIGIAGMFLLQIFGVLFGAGLIYKWQETLQLACYLSMLSIYPASFVLQWDQDSWMRIFVHNSPESFTETGLYCQGMLAIFGAWLGSIVIPLDWDRPWQVWPVPCVLGAVIFYCIGTVASLGVCVAMRQRAARAAFGITDDVVGGAHRGKAKAA